MKHLTILAFIAVGVATGACHSDERVESSDIKVTNGKPETGYPYVVRITMNNGGSCTGSFVSDSLLVTAAHCVDKASSLSWNGISADKSKFFIHHGWPTPESGCGLVRNSKYDLALVQFPKKSYTGTVYAQLLQRRPKVDESFTIVGYGNSLIEPFDVFCKLPTIPSSDGKCHVQKGQRTEGARYDYSSVFEFKPQMESAGTGCPVACNSNTLRSQLSANNLSYAEFVMNQCDGNFRDRSYRESGGGVKRSGSNVIGKVLDGTLEFTGAIGGEPTGVHSASGAGDSGGPLFILEKGKPYLAAVTHGGSLVTDKDEFNKRSIYVDLTAPHNLDWIKKTVLDNKLDFPLILAK